MYGAYMAGVIIGQFVIGCVFGLFPLIVGIVKKRSGAGILWMLVCGVCAFVHALLTLAVAIVSGIVLICQPKKTAPAAPEATETMETPESEETILPEVPENDTALL